MGSERIDRRYELRVTGVTSYRLKVLKREMAPQVLDVQFSHQGKAESKNPEDPVNPV
jgi:hypothetical protein